MPTGVDEVGDMVHPKFQSRLQPSGARLLVCINLVDSRLENHVGLTLKIGVILTSEAC